MELLSKLITNDTPFIELETENNIKLREKKDIIGFENHNLRRYMFMMYQTNNEWYFFKSDNLNKHIPYALINELLGFYISKLKNLKTVSYEMAKVGDRIGIASKNFKDDSHNYFYADQLSIPIDTYTITLYNIDILEWVCNGRDNYNTFLQHLFQLISIDFYMIQKDRCNCNIQFQKNIENQFFDIAPIYDFSNCDDQMFFNNIMIPNVIIVLNDKNIPLLIKKYPLFGDILKDTFDIDMVNLIENFSTDFYFNRNTKEYQNLIDYYELKQQNQRKILKKVLK